MALSDERKAELRGYENPLHDHDASVEEVNQLLDEIEELKGKLDAANIVIRHVGAWESRVNEVLGVCPHCDNDGWPCPMCDAPSDS